jgi:hypothetical protein
MLRVIYQIAACCPFQTQKQKVSSNRLGFPVSLYRLSGGFSLTVLTIHNVLLRLFSLMPFVCLPMQRYDVNSILYLI